jgi:hypothetical protein
MRSTRSLPGLVLLGTLLAAACGGSGTGSAAATPPAAKQDAAVETRWMRGLWANDIRGVVMPLGLTCKGPNTENRSSVWMCDSATPLVSYKMKFYGSAPGKIEYINAVVEQSGRAKDDLPLRFFGALAGLHFEGADQAKLRNWIKTMLPVGGTTEFGSVKYKLAGDANRRLFDMKASGSEW